MATLQQTRVDALPKQRHHWGIGEIKRHLEYVLMVLPGTIWLLLFCYIPMPGVVVAFKNYMLQKPAKGTMWPMSNMFINSVVKSKWLGLQNFKFMFASPDAWTMTRNTVAYNLVFIVIGLILSVGLAICISELRQRRMAKLYQTIFFFPYFISWIVVSYLVYALMNNEYGLFNQMLVSMGREPVQWYQQVSLWPWIIIIVNFWKNTGNGSIIYLAAITGMDQELNEAAAIDGASKWQQIWKITIPQLIPMMVLLTILNIGSIFRSNFDLFYTLPNGAGVLRPVTLTIDVYVFNAMRTNSKLGLPAAAGLYQSAVGFILILATNMAVRKFRPEMALF